MAATEAQIAWAEHALGHKVEVEEGVIIHADGTEELVTYLMPDPKKPVKDAAEPADKHT